MTYLQKDKQRHKAWLQTNLLKPIMPIQEKQRRNRIDMENDICITCSDVFYSGYLLPREEQCEQCIPFKNNYKVSIWLPKETKNKILLSYIYGHFDYSLSNVEYNLNHKRPDINYRLLPELVNMIIKYCN